MQFTSFWTDFSLPMVTAFSLFNISIAIANKPGKKFKKPFVYTARVKRMLTTFFILIAVIFACAVAVGYQKCKCEAWREHIFTNPLSYILIGSAE